MTTNFQSTVTAKNAITLLLKEVISVPFDQNPPQGENWPTEGRWRQNTEEDRTHKRTEHRRRQKKKSEVGSEVFSLCGVIIVHSYEVL
jgi:hypothetical protein